MGWLHDVPAHAVAAVVSYEVSYEVGLGAWVEMSAHLAGFQCV
jgi:hypothetical protein